MFEIEYNGETSSFHGIMIQSRPNIPAPVRNIEVVEIPGRDESLYQAADIAYDDITITVEMGFHTPQNRWGMKARQVKQWLSGDGKLKFSDDPEYFYLVKTIELGEIERKIRRAGIFEVDFVCSPFCYPEDGTLEKTIDEVKYNPYMLCHPVYKITGNGQCTLTVNGKSMSADVAQNITIDTERMLAYRQDGTWQNTAVTGDYESLYLEHGDNSISITSGFSLIVVPQWRCL